MIYFEDTGSNKMTQRLNVIQVKGDRLLGVIAWNSRTKSYAFHCDRHTILTPSVMELIVKKINEMGCDDPNL